MTSAPRPRPVVVGVDGSRAALAIAIEEARRRYAPLRLLHALSWQRRPTSSAAAGPAGRSPTTRSPRVDAVTADGVSD